ncbi:hypothetical protein [Photobacterium halotolerans]|uniref:Uncharacterized protein n=1 Tax=Photobacterium halotolerans TaxID=265726 RepID=A0A7X4W806_9GAMM|nr:hypothetical protein [Photobacterium halotolerans]NAW63881.1 hypothetical protein [Photobacterium halotolerans]
MTKFLKSAGLLFFLFSTPLSMAAENYVSGKITNITAIEGALLVKVENQIIPENCAGTHYNWMKIKQENTTMISVVLAQWAANNRAATVYTSGIETGGQYCLVIQVDPAG